MLVRVKFRTITNDWYGYEASDRLHIMVGDTVIVPKNRFRNRTSQGTVIGVNDFDPDEIPGPLARILGVKYRASKSEPA